MRAILESPELVELVRLSNTPDLDARITGAKAALAAGCRNKAEFEIVIGEAYLRQTDLDAAIAAAQRSLGHRETRHGYFIKGFALLGQKRPSEADEVFDRIDTAATQVSVHSRCREYYFRAVAAQLSGKPAKADALYHQVPTCRDFDRFAVWKTAKHFAFTPDRLRRDADAVRACSRKLREKSATDATADLVDAYALIADGRANEAKTTLEAMTTTFPPLVKERQRLLDGLNQTRNAARAKGVLQ